MLRTVIQGATDYAGLWALRSLGAQLSAAATRAELTPCLLATLHASTCE